MTNDVPRRLRLTLLKRGTLNLNTFGNNKSNAKAATFSSFTSRSRRVEKAKNFPTICSPVDFEVRSKNYEHLKDLELADFEKNSNGDKTIDILAGADFYWQFVTGEFVRTSKIMTEGGFNVRKWHSN